MPFNTDIRLQKAVALAGDTSKLLITLATAFVAFTVTFTEKIGGLLSGPAGQRWLLALTWAGFAISVGFGIAVLLALTGELEQKAGQLAREPSIRAPKVQGNFKGQVLTFALATIMGAWFGGCRILGSSPPPDQAQAPEAVRLTDPHLVTIQLPAFTPGSIVEDSTVIDGVCEARGTLGRANARVALVAGRHDRTPLRPSGVLRFDSNAGLALRRAERVAELLKDAELCPGMNVPPISQVMVLSLPPRHVSREDKRPAAELAAELEKDRRVEVYGLTPQDVQPPGVPVVAAPSRR